MTDWKPIDTNTHQDHVIAHVIGATVLGYFIHDETLHLLLDIGFIWNVYLDGEMGLLPHPVAVGELEVSEDERRQIKSDIELLLRDRSGTPLARLTASPVNCLIEEVAFLGKGDERRVLLTGEDESLAITTSMVNREITILGIGARQK